MKSYAKIIMIASFGFAAIAHAQSSGNEVYAPPKYPQQRYYDQGQSQQQYKDGRYDRGYAPRYSQGRDYRYGRHENAARIKRDPDVAINVKVLRNILHTPYFSRAAKNLIVTTKAGKVTIKGNVANKNEKEQIAAMVKNIPGVKSVSMDVKTEK